MKSIASLALILASFAPSSLQAKEHDVDGWVNMFDGKTFAGWKANEMPEQWTIEDGAIITAPIRSHLFYTLDEFTDFEFSAEVKTIPGSNSGIYFHTQWQDEGWPETGYESQVNQTQGDPVKSGSLYNVIKLYESPAEDNRWYEHRILVQGKNIRIHVNGKLVIDYTEPEGITGPRRLSHGTIALQGHDPESVVYFRNLRIRRLE